jgi:iron complex outermembrane recepter protein
MKLSLILKTVAAILTAAVFYTASYAADAPADSSFVELEDLVVSGEAAAPPVPGSTKIGAPAVTMRDPGSLADLGGLLPSVRVATNSRGDSHLMVRGAPERHSQAFLDGIPLNLPWDERVDLETIPITGVGQLEGRRGLPSLLEGPGVLAGSVRILPPKLNGLKESTLVSLAAGEHGLGRANLTHQREAGAWDLLGAGSVQKRDAWPLPGSDDLRDNSDLQQYSLLLRGSREVAGSGRLNLLATGWSGEKGVPAELHLGHEARFWRYPVRKRALLGASVALPFGHWDLSSLVAADFYAQEIDPRGPDNWDAPLNEGDDYEKDFDRTGHAQVGLTRWLGTHSRLSFQGNVRYTQHREILTFGGATNSYAQWLTGLVVEAEHHFATVWGMRAGAGWDHAATPESGDKNKADGFDAPALNLRLSRQLGRRSELYVSGSRRSRFPSLRELYSGALGRFVPNPDLRPERQDLLEAGVTAQSSGWHFSGAAFLQYLSDGIEKEALPGPDRQFMRVNRTKIRVAGLEVAGGWRPWPDLEITGQHTIMAARVEADGEFDRPAEDRPDYLSHLGINWQGYTGPGALVEAAVTGPRWSADTTDAEDGLTRLPAGVRWNMRLSWRWEMGGGGDSAGTELEAHLRLDNVFDQWTNYQVGLPEPGRVFSGGLMVRM